MVRLRLDVLKKQAQERTDSNLLNGIKCNSTPNPETTLSCHGVAKLYGCSTPSAGYYWEQKFKSLGHLLIYGNVIEIKNHRNPIIWEKEVNQTDNGVYGTKTRKGKKYYFKRLANSLQILQDVKKPLFL
jgi:hypothetical protein